MQGYNNPSILDNNQYSTMDSYGGGQTNYGHTDYGSPLSSTKLSITGVTYPTVGPPQSQTTVGPLQSPTNTTKSKEFNPNDVAVTTGVCSNCCYTEKCSRDLFVCFTIMFLLGISMIPAFYITQLVPFNKASKFEGANCTVIKANYTRQIISCSCGKNCR